MAAPVGETVPVTLNRKGASASAPALPPVRPATAPPYFHVMAKPTGPICNLDCEYCFFLSKEALYPGDRFRMSDELLETYVRQLIESQTAPEVTVAWQGGEPTLMGLDFFRRAVAYAESCKHSDQTLQHTIQTNGTLLTDDWCEFLAEKNFLVGISIDGPRELHDRYRVDKKGRETLDRVLRGHGLLVAHHVEYNILCTVNAANQHHPLEVYEFFRDELGAQHIQFIPIVERVDDTGRGDEGSRAVTDRSVDPVAWGAFLTAIFDEWVVRDVGTVFVQTFDASLASWYGVPPGICVFAETCGNALALEHNGDVYSCDHFVDPEYLLGNVTQTHLIELVASTQQREFGNDKRNTLPRFCLECDVRFACNGECPKNRFVLTPDGEEGLNYLCAGYKAYFEHVTGLMNVMTELLRRGRLAEDVMAAIATTPRNEPCLCGSGRKAKQCHQGHRRGRPVAPGNAALSTTVRAPN